MAVNVKSLAEFSDLVKEFKRQRGRTDTNCFLMPDEIERYASKGKLGFVRREEVLYFLCDEKEYQRMYFYLPKEAKACMEEPDKTTILDFVYRDGRISPRQEILFKKWTNCGFLDYKLYQRMCISLKDAAPSLEQIREPDAAYRFGKAEERFASQYRSLWLEGLDELSTPLPDPDEISRRIQDGEIFSITYKGEEPCAVMEADLNGRSCFLQHLSVSGKHKRQGLGEYMMKKSMQYAYRQGMETCTLWVDAQNIPAVRLHEKCGFGLEGVYSKQFIYYKKEKGEERK